MKRDYEWQAVSSKGVRLQNESGYNAEEKKTILQRITEWLSDIIEAIKEIMNDGKLNGAGKLFAKQQCDELARIRKMFLEALDGAGANYREKGAVEGDVRNSIVVLENGNVYVKANRKVINGTTVDEMRSEISRFFNALLENNASMEIPTIDVDVLTITKEDTADKARDNYKTVNNQRIKMTDEEFTVKMNIESHIDEVAEVSTPDGKKSDSKSHSFATDGFTYRRAYFEDFDGQYYEVTLSIGHNGTIATVYNVGKIKESVLPSAKIIAVVRSKPLGKTLYNNISDSADNVKNQNKVYLDAKGEVTPCQKGLIPTIQTSVIPSHSPTSMTFTRATLKR